MQSAHRADPSPYLLMRSLIDLEHSERILLPVRDRQAGCGDPWTYLWNLEEASVVVIFHFRKIL